MIETMTNSMTTLLELNITSLIDGSILGKKYRGQFGIRAVVEDLEAGQINSTEITDPYKIGVETKTSRGFFKKWFFVSVILHIKVSG